MAEAVGNTEDPMNSVQHLAEHQAAYVSYRLAQQLISVVSKLMAHAGSVSAMLRPAERIQIHLCILTFQDYLIYE